MRSEESSRKSGGDEATNDAMTGRIADADIESDEGSATSVRLRIGLKTFTGLAAVKRRLAASCDRQQSTACIADAQSWCPFSQQAMRAAGSDSAGRQLANAAVLTLNVSAVVARRRIQQSIHPIVEVPSGTVKSPVCHGVSGQPAAIPTQHPPAPPD